MSLNRAVRQFPFHLMVSFQAFLLFRLTSKEYRGMREDLMNDNDDTMTSL